MIVLIKYLVFLKLFVLVGQQHRLLLKINVLKLVGMMMKMKILQVQQKNENLKLLKQQQQQQLKHFLVILHKKV